MIRTVLLLLMLTYAAGPASAATRVFMFGGQSNMVGPVTDLSTMPAAWRTQPANVTLWLDGAVTPFSGLTEFAAEVAFGHYAARVYPDDDIYLVKRAVGGTPMACWMPVFDAVAVDTVDGKCTSSNYPKWMNDLAAAMAGDTGAVVEAVLWDQGGRDARYEDYAPAYYGRMCEFLDSLRADLGNPNLQVIAGNVVARDAEWRDTVRAAQLRLAAEREYYHVINNDDLPMAYDKKHFTSWSQILAGTRMALTYFGMNACTDGTAPAVPDSVAGEGLSGTSVKISWAPAAAEPCGIKYYLVKRNGALHDSSILCSYFDRALLNDTEYEYEVAAVGWNGDTSAYSSPVAARTLDATGEERVARWSFDSTLVDSGAYRYDATWAVDTAYGTGKVGTGLHLDGTDSGAYVRILNHTDLWYPLDQLSFGMWAKKDAPGTGGALLKKLGTFDMYVSDSVVSGRFFSTDSSYDFTVTVPAVYDTAWHYYLYVYDGTALRIYVDGSEVFMRPHTGMVAQGGNNDCDVARDPRGDKMRFAGSVDELAVWHRPVPAGEAVLLYGGPVSAVRVPGPGVHTDTRNKCDAGTYYTVQGVAVHGVPMRPGVYVRYDGTKPVKTVIIK